MYSEEKNQTKHEVDHRFDSLAKNVANTAGLPVDALLWRLLGGVTAQSPMRIRCHVGFEFCRRALLLNLICVLLSRALGIFQFLQRIASRTLKMGAEFVLATTKHQDAIPVDRLIAASAHSLDQRIGTCDIDHFARIALGGCCDGARLGF